MLVLALLQERESYGYELVTRLRTDGLVDITTGTVYPVLTRLERDGHIDSRLVASRTGPARKYYHPTPSGAAELSRARSGWVALTQNVRTTLARLDSEDAVAPSPPPSTEEEDP